MSIKNVFHLGFPVIGKTHFSLKLPMYFWEGFCMKLSPYSILYFVFFIVCFVFAYCPNSTLPQITGNTFLKARVTYSLHTVQPTSVIYTVSLLIS